MTEPWGDHQEQHRSQLEPRKQAMCATEGAAVEVTQGLWTIPEEHEWIPDIELFPLLQVDFTWFRL